MDWDYKVDIRAIVIMVSAIRMVDFGALFLGTYKTNPQAGWRPLFKGRCFRPKTPDACSKIRQFLTKPKSNQYEANFYLNCLDVGSSGRAASIFCREGWNAK
jgi:hypothetical protein